MRLLTAIMLLVLLAGCGGVVSPPAADLRRPSARTMVPPVDLPDVPPGQNLYVSDSQCSAQYVHETGKLRSLQGYVSTLLKK